MNTPRGTMLIFLVLIVASTSCRTMLRPQRQEHSLALPERFTADPTGQKGEGAKQDWWTAFGSPELNRLVESAQTGNLSIVQVEARLRQARAVARQSLASRRLQSSVDANASTVRSETAGVSSTYEEYGLGLAASYEIDLWGGVRAGEESAAARASAAYADLQAARITVAASVAETWLAGVAQQGQIVLLEEQLKTNTNVLNLLKLRQRRALATALDVYQQEQAVASTESLLAPATDDLQLIRHKLNILLGTATGSDLPPFPAVLPVLPARPVAGVPSDLLANRPDVTAAWSRLSAADWNVAAARADRLPAISLTGRLSMSSDKVADLFDNWLANLAAGLAAPLLDGGRLRAEEDRTMSVSHELLAAYSETVLVAVKEVEDAIVREHRQLVFLAALEKEHSAASSALGEAERRYRNGATDYLNVLSALSGRQRLDRTLLAASQDLLEYRVSLYRALASGWAEVDLNSKKVTRRAELER